MPDEQKPHLRIEQFSQSEDYVSKRRGDSEPIPQLNRTQHGNALLQAYEGALTNYAHRRATAQPSLTEETGLYLELTGWPHRKLPLEKLDSVRDYRLQSVHVDESGAEVAVIFVPDSRRSAMQRKLQAYLDPVKDSKKSELPRNQSLVDSIAGLRLANIQSFWTDHFGLFPLDNQQVCWWELWLTKQPGLDLLGTVRAFSQRVNARLGNTAISFHSSAVVLIRASINQLEQATELMSCLAELRLAKETPTVLVRENPMQQTAWAVDLSDRIQVDKDANVFISVLDTGVNYDHPILSHACLAEFATSWHPSWPKYTASVTNIDLHHGSEQAGLAMFGDLFDALVSTEPIVLGHRIESGRILPPTGVNDPELYGAITTDTAHKLEQARPNATRIYSMAVTAPSYRLGGEPTSWSSTIDNFCAGANDGRKRLFVVSAGNVHDLSAHTDYWEQAHMEEIEDPAQAWNALTVGAYTERTTNDDFGYAGWSPLAVAGDLCPWSRTSVQWPLRKVAPYKPDLVAEGGNALLSPDHTTVTDADVVSLLTTSGRSTGQLFATTGATSAATAIVSHQAAVLASEYPEYWPETIRGLLVHSAEWTQRMFERMGQLEMRHSRRVVNETMLRSFGFGVPSLDRARYSASHLLTLIAQNDLKPYKREMDATAAEDATLNEMHFYELPWPVDALQSLPPDTDIQMRVTLSYFVEPNPSRRGHRNRFTYPSCGLRFEVKRPTQSLPNFRAALNRLAVQEDYDGPEGSTDGWRFGSQLRTRGSLHSDIWTGKAADLAQMNAVAVYPVSGWWKSRSSEGRWDKRVRYSLIVGIYAPDEALDLYSEVENIIATTILV